MQSSIFHLQQVSSFFKQHTRFFTTLLILLSALMLVPTSALAVTQSRHDGEPGMDRNTPGTKDGQTRLINNWTVTPAGRQIALGDLPLNAVLSPDGKYLLVVNSGTGIQSLQVVATRDNTIVQEIPYTVPQSVFVGLIYSPDGTKAYAAGGGEEVVHTFDVTSSGKLKANGDITLGTRQANPFPTGLSSSPDGRILYVANNLANDVAVIDTTTRKIITTIKVGSYPYMPLVSKDGKSLYVSNWGDATLSVIDTASRTVEKTISVGQHPTTMVHAYHSAYLYVAAANSDAVSVVDTDTLKEVDTISVAPYKNAPLSSSPQGLALSHDDQFLYVVNAGNNEVVVIHLRGEQPAISGRIPTAWYPTSINISTDDATLYVTNGKGYGAGPNTKAGFAPDPTRKNAPIINGITGYNNKYCNCTFNNYTGSMMVGTLSTITVPGDGQLRLYTEQVARNDREQDTSVDERNAGNPIPLAGHTSSIKHVIYVIKENRTYDQVLGDERAGDGDPDLTLFPRNNTPNLHALAERFGLFDNFYADAEVSADGHNWANSANASDYNEKMWPQNYAPRPGRNRSEDFEGDSQINLSPGGYLWDAAAQARISYRDYGEFYQYRKPAPTLIAASQTSSCAGPIAHTYTGVSVPAGQVLCFTAESVNTQTNPHLADHFDPKYRTFDLNYREAERIAEWQREFTQFVAQDSLPQLEIVRLPDDHTQGTMAGKLTPQAMVAENDHAVGKLIDILSHSKYWSTSAVFITEDDAQNGPDHVDAHRTESLVVSPYTAHAQIQVDHTLYDTAAMVRTIELILGLHPLSQYDTNAVPMWRAFENRADLQAYNAQDENIPVTQLNSETTFGAQASAKMDFSQEDRIPMDQLNQILWHAIKGTHTAYPEKSATGNSRSSTPENDG